MNGAAATIMRQLAEICAQPEKAKRINVSYSITDTHVAPSGTVVKGRY